MTMIQLIACIGMIAGLFMVLGISPTEMSDSIFSRLTAAPGSIRADINETTKRKKAGFFRREITENRLEGDRFIIEGQHRKCEEMSGSLPRRFIENGMPRGELEAFLQRKEVTA